MPRTYRNRGEDPRYDAAVRIAALRGYFVNRHALPEIQEGEAPSQLCDRYEIEQGWRDA